MTPRPGRATRSVAAILAGGAATRLGGGAKGLVEVGGRRIIDRQLEVLGPRVARVLVVTMDPAPWAGLPVVCVPDRAGPGLGPLAGLDAALAALRPPEDAVLAVGGDMPFLAPALIELLRDHPSPAAALVPWYGGHPQPLLARYTLAAAPAIAAALRAGRLKVAALPDAVPTERLDEAELRAVDPALASFLNVNTPDDLARARALAGG